MAQWYLGLAMGLLIGLPIGRISFRLGWTPRYDATGRVYLWHR